MFSGGPRDVKSLVTANVKKIYSFLIEFEGSEAPSEKDIKSPRGMNDFISIFESIFHHLNKDYKYPQSARVEEEISQIFKGLQYPFPLKVSFFQPFGSSHGYPHLLDALAWLVDLVRMNSCTNDTNEKEMLKMQMTKIEKELEEKKKNLETSIRQKLDQIVAETAEIENAKMMLLEMKCTELEKTVKAMCLN